MKINRLALLSCTSLLLFGCDKQIPTASCSSPETQQLFAAQLTEQAATLTVANRDDQYGGATVFGAVKVNTQLAKLQIAIANAKTSKEAANGRQSICSGELQVTVPPAILADVDFVRDAQHQPKIAQYASQLNIANSNNVFSQPVEYTAEYTVEPTGNNKQLHVNFKNEVWPHFLVEIATAALLKPTLNPQNTMSVQPDGQQTPKPTVKVAPVTPEAEEPNKLNADKPRAVPNKLGLEKLNQELREEEQAQKSFPQKAKGQDVQQAIPPLVPPVTATKPKAPSFNCSKTKKAADLTVCASPELVALDVKNMQLYKKAKAINAAATKTIFIASIKSKYACGADIDCIKKVYQQSIYNYGCVAAGKTSNCSAAATPETDRKGVTQ